MSNARRPSPRSRSAPGALVAAAAVLAGLGAAFAAPAAGVPARAQAPAECSLTVDKTALPTTIWLGETVTVTLSIGGTCPAKEVKADVVLAIDRSSSMERYNKLTSARAAAKSFIDTINPSLVHVGIVAFDDVAESIAYLTGDQAALRAAVDGIRSDTGTNLVDGLDEARKMLASAGARPDARPVIIFMTDGKHSVNNPPISDLPRVIAQVRAAGILVYSIGLGPSSEVDEANLRLMASDPSKFLRSPTASELNDIYVHLAGRLEATVLMEDVFIVDELPADMTFVPGSGIVTGTGLPMEPTVSPDGRTLTWRLVAVPLPPPILGLAYRVRPTVTGVRPTNVEAHADVTDGFGVRHALVFPIPRVTVLAPATPTPTPLPTATPPPDAMCVCRVTRNKVPQSVIDAALANPAKVYGWLNPLNPNVPGPVEPPNPPRMCLDLLNRGRPFHPLFNSVIWRAGCLIGPP